MITVRKSEERRHFGNEKQVTWMTFDPENKADPMGGGFGDLEIFNEEILPPGRGFVLHTHKDLVVVTYVREGMIVFKGLLEEADLIKQGEFHMINSVPGEKLIGIDRSAGEETHVFQSGFSPAADFLEAGGRKKFFTLAERKGILKLIASPDGKEASLKILQDVQIYSILVHKGNHMIHELSPGRNAWLHVVKGWISLDDLQLHTGDGAGFSDELSVSFTSLEPSEILLFDLNGQKKNEPEKSGNEKLRTAEIG